MLAWRHELVMHGTNIHHMPVQLTSMLAQFRWGSTASAPHMEQGAAASSGASSSLSGIGNNKGKIEILEWDWRAEGRAGRVSYMCMCKRMLPHAPVPAVGCGWAAMTVDANTERLHAIRPLTGADGHATVKHEQRACKKRAGRAGGWGLGVVRIREAHELVACR